ncbi:MAG: hypothetical protein R3283_11410, partial [Balneolaceae bacterium]|nr:hypothetical protein [Balneolaceae bacterium]
ESNYESIDQGDMIRIENLRQQLRDGNHVQVKNETKGTEFTVKHTLSGRQLEALLAGGVINHYKQRN